MLNKSKSTNHIVTITGSDSQTAQYKVNNNKDLLILIENLITNNKDTFSSINIKNTTK